MPNLAQILSTKAAPKYRYIFEVCREVSKQTAEADEVYAVGGVVRDLLAGKAAGDIDISVVGDAETFAHRMASALKAPPPQQSQFLTYKVNTDNVFSSRCSIDIATARSETYVRPGALPEVKAGNIKNDLLRRDFTVNSMAICLDNNNWGLLVDPSNGFADIMRKRLKVHHGKSFIDDPTRIFRAIRYSTRLGFALHTNTKRLIGESINGITNLSDDRARHEFELFFTEKNLSTLLRNSQSLGLLGAITPGFRVSTQTLDTIDSLIDQQQLSGDIEDLVALITLGLTEDEANRVVERFGNHHHWRRPVEGNISLGKRVSSLDKDDLQPSDIDDLLHAIPLSSIRAYNHNSPSLPRQNKLSEYLQTIRFIQPEITGVDLLEIGLPEGPIVGQMIQAARRARMDGIVRTKNEEIELVKKRLPNFLTR